MVAWVDRRQEGLFCLKLAFLLLPSAHVAKLREGTHTRRWSYRRQLVNLKFFCTSVVVLCLQMYECIGMT